MTLPVLTNAAMFAALVGVMLSMGLRVTIKEVIESGRQFRLMFFGLLANFVLVPLATVGLLYCFGANAMVSTGFLVLAVCPGAPLGPPFTAMAKGDVPCAVGLMVILSGLSAILSPALLTGSLAYIAPESDLRVDYLAIVRTLIVVQILPFVIGLAIRQWASELAHSIERPTALLANLLLCVGLVLILATQYEALGSIRLRGWGGMLCLLLASLAIGWLSGGPLETTRKALAVTTAVRNAAVGLVIVSTNMPETPAVTAVVAYALVSILGALGFALALRTLPGITHAARVQGASR